MSLRHGLLGLLNYGPMTGYDLSKAFEASLNFFWQAQTSQIYRELGAMEKSGWLTSKIEIQTSKPNKKRYFITNLGKRELMDWLQDDNLNGGLKVRSEFLLKLFFAGEQSARESITMLESFRSACAKELEELAQTDGSIEQYRAEIDAPADAKAIYWRLTASFGKAYMSMCLEFADEAIKALEGYDEHPGA